jgi:hypothetical protein
MSQAVKAMRFDPRANMENLEDADTVKERAKAEGEFAKAIAEAEDEF